MNKLRGYEEAQTYTENERLPVGGYMLTILGTKLQQSDYGETLILSFDIKEGEYKGFFADNYKSQIQEDKKWKGTYRLKIPKDDGTEQDNWTMKRFKTVMVNFEESNQGFHWGWDEQKLKGKTIGGLFNNKEYEFDGRNGFFTNCHSLISAERIKTGKFKIPEDTMLKKNNALAPKTDEQGFMNIPDGIDEELPFN